MIKSSTTRRIWDEARDKVVEEGCCRACLAPAGWQQDGTAIVLEAAHIVGRKHDPTRIGPRGGKSKVVERAGVIPLCRDCHVQFDEHRLDIVPFLFRPEEEYAVKILGLVRAYKRLSGRNG